MAIDDILNKIKSDADLEAESIKKNALLEKERFLEGAHLLSAMRRESILKDAASDAEQEAHRIETGAVLESRKNVLSVKQGFIEECFKRALDEIINLDSSGYQKLIKELILAHIEENSGQQLLVLSKNDKGRFNPHDLVKEVNNTLEEKGMSTRIKLASEFGDFSGGFLLQSGKKSANLSLDMLFRIKKPEWESEVVKILFP